VRGVQIFTNSREFVRLVLNDFPNVYSLFSRGGGRAVAVRTGRVGAACACTSDRTCGTNSRLGSCTRACTCTRTRTRTRD
jgi:hypothetical protein